MQALDRTVSDATDRLDLWAKLLTGGAVEIMAEVGVQRGMFAAAMLSECPSLKRYYMIDPWRHLDSWNKPSNRAQDVHEQFYDETLRNTELFASKRVILRGTTTEVIDQIEDGELDFAYIDGDHTLRGITIDLARVWPKVREGGFIGGDDLSPSIWQHDRRYEPTLVFPYAVYFAEAMGVPVYALPFRQFLLQKTRGGNFGFVDMVGAYGRLTLGSQLLNPEREESAQARPADLLGRIRRRLRW